MDPETALFWNHIFGNALWVVLLLIGAVLLIISLIKTMNVRTKKICRMAGVSSIILFAFAVFMSMYTYAEVSVRYADDEYPACNDVSATVVGPYTIRFTNNGDETVMISDRYKIEYLSGRAWYNVDVGSPELRTASFAPYELDPGESVDLTFDISCYGDLKPRHYRYAVEESYMFYYYAEFDITEYDRFIWPE